MKKLFLPTVLAMLLFTTSCKKDLLQQKDSGYFLNVTVMGQTLNASSAIGGFGFADQFGCDGTDNYANDNIGQIENTAYFIEINVNYKQDNKDFASSTARMYSVKVRDLFSLNPYPLGIPCNLDLGVFLEDKSLSNEETRLMSAGRLHKVTSISISSETGNDVTYDIAGTFSCSLKNSANVTIPVSGSYKTFITVFK